MDFRRPSFLSMGFTGILLTVAIIVFLINYKDITGSNSTGTLLMLILLFTIAAGVHGLQHLGEQIYYNFNPLSCDNKIK